MSNVKKEVLAATAPSYPEGLLVTARTCAARKIRLTKSAIREPKQAQKLVLGERESFRNSSILSDLILEIRPSLKIGELRRHGAAENPTFERQRVYIPDCYLFFSLALHK